MSDEFANCSAAGMDEIHILAVSICANNQRIVCVCVCVCVCFILVIYVSQTEGGMPQWTSIRTSCSITILTVEAAFKVGRLPIIKAPISCSVGISNGKLKGEMMQTGPNGHLQFVHLCPTRLPETCWPAALNLHTYKRKKYYYKTPIPLLLTCQTLSL